MINLMSLSLETDSKSLHQLVKSFEYLKLHALFFKAENLTKSNISTCMVMTAFLSCLNKLIGVDEVLESLSY